MYWLFCVSDSVVTKAWIGALATVVCAVVGAWRYRHPKPGKSSAERLGNIEGRLCSVESEVKQTRSEMNSQLAEIRGYVMRDK